MRLETLAAALSAPSAAVLRPDQAAVEIQGLAYDSRAVGPGDLFFCVTGFRSDGHEFASQALQRGAAALVVERELGLIDIQATRNGKLDPPWWDLPLRMVLIAGLVVSVTLIAPYVGPKTSGVLASSYSANRRPEL